ncbi:hypothetical protein HQ447_11185 [bacterium]|nr:hypothetical protein [bacterium]
MKGRSASLFVTFKGEQTPMSEQVYFAVSRDGRQWNPLNHGEPVLISNLGERGVRDPYLIRSHDGRKFFILATDLSIHLNPAWDRAQTAGCSWAPEAVYAEETKDYLVFWASKNRSDNFAKQRVWAARTRDFRTFGDPFVYIDKPNPVIDTNIVREYGERARPRPLVCCLSPPRHSGWQWLQA